MKVCDVDFTVLNLLLSIPFRFVGILVVLIHSMFVCVIDIRKRQLSARNHFQRISNDHEKIKLQLESHKKELEMLGMELEKRDAHNESERRKLAEEIEKVALF